MPLPRKEMEVTRLKEWEKSRATELEAHRQVAHTQLLLVIFSSPCPLLLLSFSLLPLLLLLPSPSSLYPLCPARDGERDRAAGEEGDAGHGRRGDEDQGGGADQGHRRHQGRRHRRQELHRRHAQLQGHQGGGQTNPESSLVRNPVTPPSPDGGAERPEGAAEGAEPAAAGGDAGQGEAGGQEQGQPDEGGGGDR